MEINIKGNSITAFSTVLGNLFGRTQFSMRVISLIIESPGQESIDGQIEASMKVRLKTAYVMVSENTLSKKRLTKANGFKEKNREKVKSFSKVEASSKALSKMISNKDMEKCITIHLVTISKASGRMIKRKEKAP